MLANCVVVVTPDGGALSGIVALSNGVDGGGGVKPGPEPTLLPPPPQLASITADRPANTLFLIAPFIMVPLLY
jgi:hypothetical protein